MSHDWGISVPPDLPTEQVFEILEKLRAGTLMLELPAAVQTHQKAAEWCAELNAQMLAAYEKEAARRRS